MSTTTTPVLGIVKATPGTAEPFSTIVVNANWDKIDTAIGPKATKFSTTTVGTTVVETTLNNIVVPAASAVQGTVYKLVVFGTYDHSAVSTTLTLRLKLGGTVVNTITITTPATLQTNRALRLEAELVCATTGVTGTWRTTLFGTAEIAATVTPLTMIPNAATTKDTTAAQNLEITAQWGSGIAANVVRADAGYAYRVTNV